MGVIYCCIWWINCFFCFFIIWNINNLKRNKMKLTLEEAKERYLDSPLPHSYKLAVEFGAKWQQERMYSEEEVLELLTKAHFVGQNIVEWFEQNKKK